MNPSSNLRLLNNDIHVWRLKLDSNRIDLQQLLKILSSDEQGAARRFHFDRHRRRYIVSHAMLRIILGEFYLNIEPKKLEFGYGDYGKPHISGRLYERKLCFNVATSHELALYAFARNDEIGIDVEFQRELTDADEVATRTFSSGEIAAYQSLPGKTKTKGFYNCWTRKEAFIKAVGKGLSFPLDKFEVSLVPGEPARLISIEGDTVKAKKWTLESFNPGQGYTAAMAVQKLGVNLSYWQLPESAGHIYPQNP